MRAAEAIAAIGLARFLPAMSGAEPWMGSYSPERSPRLAEGNNPIDPVVRVRLSHACDHLSPQSGAFKDIRLVHRCHLLLPQAGKLKGPVRHAFSLMFMINFGIDPHSLAVLCENPARIPKINPT